MSCDVGEEKEGLVNETLFRTSNPKHPVSYLLENSLHSPPNAQLVKNWTIKGPHSRGLVLSIPRERGSFIVMLCRLERSNSHVNYSLNVSI